MRLQTATLRKANGEMATHYANTEVKIAELDTMMADADSECSLD